MSSIKHHGLTRSILVGLLSSIALQAQAAGWALLPGGTVFDLSDQAVEVNGQFHGQTSLGELQDLSGTSTWLHTTAHSHVEDTAAGPLELGHEGTISVDASGGASASLLLSATQYMKLDLAQPVQLSSLSWTQDVATTNVRLQIQGDETQAPGQRVKVSFQGLADVLHGGDAIEVGGESQLDLAFVVEGQVVSSLSVNAGGTFSQALDLSFEALVGDVVEVTLAAHQSLWQVGTLSMPASQTLSLDRSAFLQGTLHVTAVPEADAAWMLMGGALVLAPRLSSYLRRKSRA